AVCHSQVAKIADRRIEDKAIVDQPLGAQIMVGSAEGCITGDAPEKNLLSAATMDLRIKSLTAGAHELEAVKQVDPLDHLSVGDPTGGNKLPAAGIDCAVELTAIKKNLLNAAHIDDVGYPDGGFVQGSATECELPATDNLVAGGDTTLGDVKYSTTRNRIACSKTRSVGVTDCGSKVNDRIDDSHGAL